ncbi:MAG: hypothetical protein M3R21_02585 [Candidatus Dormibacteraeota bacterium]|nr:hypothetical protein [Candidatus Dormibacteraeota bacterium]
MRKLLRQPLTWMVSAECIVVAVLMVVVWYLVASAGPQHRFAAPIQAVEPTSQSSSTPLPEVTRSPVRAQLPGLNLDANFWRLRLGQLNRDQVSLEQLEWRIVHEAMNAARRYVETVVLPSITRAERGGG